MCLSFLRDFCLIFYWRLQKMSQPLFYIVKLFFKVFFLAWLLEKCLLLPIMVLGDKLLLSPVCQPLERLIYWIFLQFAFLQNKSRGLDCSLSFKFCRSFIKLIAFIGNRSNYLILLLKFSVQNRVRTLPEFLRGEEIIHSFMQAVSCLRIPLQSFFFS